MNLPITNSAIYHPWILPVLWTSQILSELLITGVYAVPPKDLTHTTPHPTYTHHDWQAESERLLTTHKTLVRALNFAGFTLGIALFFLMTHIVQINLYTRSALTPLANFAFELPRFLIWTAVFAFGIAGASHGMALGWALVVFIWILGLFSVGYASVVLWKYRCAGGYKGAGGMLPDRARYEDLDQCRLGDWEDEMALLEEQQHGASDKEREE